MHLDCHEFKVNLGYRVGTCLFKRKTRQTLSTTTTSRGLLAEQPHLCSRHQDISCDPQLTITAFLAGQQIRLL